MYVMDWSRRKYASAYIRKNMVFPDEEESANKSNWSGLVITGNMKNLSSDLWKLKHLTSLILKGNNLSAIPSDISQLSCLMQLDVSGNRLTNVPHEIGELTPLRNLLLHNNLISWLPYEMGKLFNLSVLSLDGNPLPTPILQVSNETNGTEKILSYLLDNLPVTLPRAPLRPWINLKDSDWTRPTCTFTVMSYNILHDKYATRQRYGYCPPWVLKWQHRRKVILEEIRRYSADIINLQELGSEQFYSDFLPQMKRDGYDGIFSPKSRAKTMTHGERRHVDGCAIFYRSDKFSLIFEHLIEFNQLALANSHGSDDMLNRVVTKDNIGLVALLETKKAAWTNGEPAQVHQHLLVCTTHIHWNSKHVDVKLVQTMMMMHELENIANDASHCGYKVDASNIQLVLCGDFNSLPDSGVVEYLNRSRIDANHEELRDFDYNTCLQRMCSSRNNQAEFTHPFRLSTAYSPEIMPYSTRTYDFTGLIDYIFYSRDTMVLLGLLGPVDEKWFKQNKVLGCPHRDFPSDHFFLLVKLELTPAINCKVNVT